MALKGKTRLIVVDSLVDQGQPIAPAATGVGRNILSLRMPTADSKLDRTVGISICGWQNRPEETASDRIRQSPEVGILIEHGSDLREAKSQNTDYKVFQQECPDVSIFTICD